MASSALVFVCGLKAIRCIRILKKPALVTKSFLALMPVLMHCWTVPRIFMANCNEKLLKTSSSEKLSPNAKSLKIFLKSEFDIKNLKRRPSNSVTASGNPFSIEFKLSALSSEKFSWFVQPVLSGVCESKLTRPIALKYFLSAVSSWRNLELAITSKGAGRPKKNPCAFSQPVNFKNSKTVSSSTPSINVPMPKSFAIFIIFFKIERDLSCVWKFWRKRLSIFSKSKLISSKTFNEEYLLPKLSSQISKPLRRNFSSTS